MALKLSDSTLIVLCLAFSAAMFFFGTGLSPVWPILWLAPRLSASSAFMIAAFAFALGSLNEWAYLALVVPLWVTTLNTVGPACVFGLAVLLFRNRIQKGHAVQAALIVPVFW